MSGSLVETRYGKVQGEVLDGVAVWKGIPYARAERFRPPEPPQAWPGVREAKDFGPAAPQPKQQLMAQLVGGPQYPESEDCLSLNIWAPAAPGEALPVMVFIHGGAYETGSGALPWYDGSSFARRGDVLLVTINYRLGPLGFLHLGDILGPEFAQSGNLGLLDQIAALRFVQENIAGFGGDPKAVTVFGESAGAGSIGMLLAAPMAQGLFQRAILQSGSGALGIRSAAAATGMARRLLGELGIDPKGARRELLTVDAHRLAEEGARLGPGMNFGPVIDGKVLPQAPLLALKDGSAKDVLVLIGTNQDEYRLLTLGDAAWLSDDEGTIRGLVERLAGEIPEPVRRYYWHRVAQASAYERLVPILTYLLFVDGMLRTVDAQAAQGLPVFMYRFDFRTPVLGGRLGACHALEIPFVFDNLGQPGTERLTGEGPERQRIAQEMHLAWSAFARTGDPSHVGIPAWPPCDGLRRPLMAFGDATHLEENPFRQEREVWGR